MISFKNPLTPLIASPVNIDIPIQELQVSLANNLGWLEKSFGRSWESKKPDLKGRIRVYPEVWQGPNTDLLNCMPNDNLKSQSFFKVEEPIRITDYQNLRYSRMEATINIIFWFNLEVLDPDLDYRFIELLKGHAQRVLTGTVLTTSFFKIVQIWEGADNVFKGYTINRPPDEPIDPALTHPWGGFRFECLLNFLENCPDVVFQT